MGMLEGPDPADPGERFDIDIEQFAAATRDTSPPAEETEIAPVTGEPALPLLEQAPLRDGALDELLAFYAYGARPADLAGAPPVTPALLAAYGDLSRVRYDYPLCLRRGDDGPAVLPLTAVVDGVIDKMEMSGDEAERLRRHLMRLESGMRAMIDDGPVPLEQLWGRATAGLLEGSEDEALRANLTAARDAADLDADVIGLDDDVPRALFAAITAREWRARSAGFGAELDGILRGLEDILRVDESHTAEATSPDHLRSASGKGDEEVDFLAMSSLLGRSHLGEPLPTERRERIRSALNVIKLAAPLFEAIDIEENPPIGVTRISTDPAAARAGYESRMQLMANFFRAVRIARIEIANGYRPDVHDAFFENFDATYLTEEEWALCPPVLVMLDPENHEDGMVDTIVDLIAGGAPFKILVRFESLLPGEDGEGVPHLITGPQARLGGMLMALGHAHVLQCGVSQVEVLAAGIAAGYAYAGPSVVAVYTGDSGASVPRFLSASSAVESRAFAAFEYDPGRGATWAERMNVMDNPAPEADWPLGTFTWRDAEGEESSEELPFTVADYLLTDPRLAEHFLSTGPDRWHENLVPLVDYVGSDGAVERKVPYITGVDPDGRVRRVAVSHDVVDAVQSCAAVWRSLQELGGINNSHALALIEAERARLVAEKDSAVAELEAKYGADLEQNIGDLTREIVGRIAAQLLSGQSIGDIAAATPAAPVAPRPATPTPAAPAETAAAEAAPAAEPEEDEVLALDDPYIDTPLCTSCNDCFKVNNQMFAYNENKQAYIADADAGPYKDLVAAAEICPVKIIHPGKPRNPNEEGLEELLKRAQPFL